MQPTSVASPTQQPNDNPAIPRVTVAHGDGIGPEIMEATLAILDAAGARLEYDRIQIGEQLYRQGHSSGISPDAWDTLRQNNVFLKGPITTPQGGGYKSLNVTIRKTMGLYANVRPCRAYTPYVESSFPDMDLVIVRENEEDLYAGIEHQQTSEVVQCLKLITRPGSERIVRYAFEYARANGRRKVTCMTKDNIMKLTDGLFHRIFNEVATEYPEIEADHYIIDIGAALLADRPAKFDVVVTPNLYGDIISDIAAQVAGSVGLGGSANIGDHLSMFEAIHGSAPDIAGQDLANPSGLLHAACMMLVHVGQPRVAERIMNALLTTLEDGVHTGDLYSETYTTARVGTREFAQAVIERLGQQPRKLAPIALGDEVTPIRVQLQERKPEVKRLVGVDIFLDWTEHGRQAEVLGQALEALSGPEFKLKMITNRGVKVYPGGFPETFCTDHWRCRFVAVTSVLDEDHKEMTHSEELPYGSVLALLGRLNQANYPAIKTENLYEIDGERVYSLGQGE